MALETVAGFLSDFGGDLDLSVHPRIVFKPNGAAVGGNTLFFGKPVLVTAFSGAGAWTTQLQSTDEMFRVTGEDVWYDVWIERLIGTVPVAGMTASNADYTPWDDTRWKLRVPPGGGQFASMVSAPSNPAQIWFEPEPPTDPSPRTGWYDTDADPAPGVPNYFEWE